MLDLAFCLIILVIAYTFLTRLFSSLLSFGKSDSISFKKAWDRFHRASISLLKEEDPSSPNQEEREKLAKEIWGE